MTKHVWRTVEELEQRLEFFQANNAPDWIIQEAAASLGAARIRDEIDQEVLDTFLGEV